jgi:hypothetical protein
MDRIRNDEIRKKLEIYSRDDNTKEYSKRELGYLQGMDDIRIAKQGFHYRPRGRRDVGRPRKRWKAETRRGRLPMLK